MVKKPWLANIDPIAELEFRVAALNAEVTRLTEEREATAIQAVELAQTTGDVVDQQRDDIRRLVGALGEAEHTSPCSDDSNLTPTAKRGRGLCYRCTLLAEIRERYGLASNAAPESE